MTTQDVRVSDLAVGDSILDNEGLELKVTALEIGVTHFASITVEYVEAALMVSRPQPTTRTVKLTSIVKKVITQ